MNTISLLSLVVLAIVDGASISGMAGEVSKAIASPNTRINLGQAQVGEFNIVSGGEKADYSLSNDEGNTDTDTPQVDNIAEETMGPHTEKPENSYPHNEDNVDADADADADMPHVDDITEEAMGPHTKQAGPALIKGCYKIIPVYKTFYKTVPSFKAVEKQVKVMVPDTKTVKEYRTVERVVKDVVPEFKQVEFLRPEYKTVTTQVPTTKTVSYKVKSYIKQTLPPTYIPEYSAQLETQPSITESQPTIEAAHVGSPNIKIKVGSLANYDQSAVKH